MLSRTVVDQIVAAACAGHTAMALVRLWHQLDRNRPTGLQAAEQQVAGDRGGFDAARTAAVTALDAGDSEGLCTVLQQWPLAVLAALDEQRHLEGAGDDGSAAACVRIDGEDYWLHRRRLLRTADAPFPARQSGHLQRWLKYHWILPARLGDIGITVRAAPHRVRARCADWLQRGRVRIWVGDFPDGIRPDWLPESECPGWRAVRLDDDAGTRQAGLLAMLDAAAAAEADLVVLPELCLPPDLQAEVENWLDAHAHPFGLVLPGTFHEAEGPRFFNRARLRDGIGATVLEHRKLKSACFDDRPELIEGGGRLDLLDTPVGLFAIPICLDYCEIGIPFGELWQRLGLEWALVPAFGPDCSVRAHARRAKEMAGFFATVTVLANQHPDGFAQDHGFVHHRARQPTVITPSARCVEVKLQSVSAVK